MNHRTRSHTESKESPKVNIKIPKTVQLILKLILTLAAIYFVVRQIDLQQVAATFRQSRILLILVALVFFIFSKGVSAIRCHLYFKSIDIKLSQIFNIKLYLLGMFYNLFLPGGIGGDGYKIYYLRKRFKIKTRDIFWAVLLDRVIGVLVLFCLAVLFVYFTGIPGKWTSFLWILIPLSVGSTWLVYRRFFPVFSGIFLSTSLQSLLVQLLQVLSAVFLLFSFGLQQDLVGYLFVFLISSIVAVLPLTIGGVGSREFTFLLGAQWLGLDINLSVALSFLFYLLTAFTSFWGIIYSVNPRLLGEPERPA
jgi:uncharacterized membrane protein YbhN (UPF0104 family)